MLNLWKKPNLIFSKKMLKKIPSAKKINNNIPGGTDLTLFALAERIRNAGNSPGTT